MRSVAEKAKKIVPVAEKAKKIVPKMVSPRPLSTVVSVPPPVPPPKTAETITDKGKGLMNLESKEGYLALGVAGTMAGMILGNKGSLPEEQEDTTADDKCIWCKDSYTENGCTKLTCKKCDYSDIIEGCKVHMMEMRFFCHEPQCRENQIAFKTANDLKEHYILTHKMGRYKEAIGCDCKARFYNEEDKKQHKSRTDRFRCPVNSNEDMKDYNLRFLQEKTLALVVFDYLSKNGLWVKDRAIVASSSMEKVSGSSKAKARGGGKGAGRGGKGRGKGKP